MKKSLIQTVNHNTIRTITVKTDKINIKINSNFTPDKNLSDILFSIVNLKLKNKLA